MKTTKITDDRKITKMLIDIVDDDLFDPYDALLMCLEWMPESLVEEMCDAEDVFWVIEDDNDEFDDEDEED